MLIQYEQTLTRVFHKISHLKYFMFQGYPDVGTLPWELVMTWEHQRNCQ